MFGLSYYDPNRKVNAMCVHNVLTNSEKFRVTVDTFGAFQVMAVPRKILLAMHCTRFGERVTNRVKTLQGDREGVRIREESKTG